MPQITRFGVGQTAKVSAVLYFVLTLVIVVPVALVVGLFGGGQAMPFGGGWIIMLLMPFLYAIVGFIGVALACLLYNAVASRIGGIEIELTGGTSGAGASSAPRS